VDQARTGRRLGGEWRRRLASIEAAAAAGLVCAAGWVWGLSGLLQGPPVGAPPEEVTAYLSSPGAGGALAQLQIVVVGTVGFLWFIGVIRARLGRSASRLVTTVNLSGAILLAACVLAGAAALATPRVLAEVGAVAPDPGAAAMARAAALVLLGFLAPRMATLVVLSSAQLGRMTGALPRWLVWLSAAVGIGESRVDRVGERGAAGPPPGGCVPTGGAGDRLRPGTAQRCSATQAAASASARATVAPTRSSPG